MVAELFPKGMPTKVKNQRVWLESWCRHLAWSFSESFEYVCPTSARGTYRADYEGRNSFLTRSSSDDSVKQANFSTPFDRSRINKCSSVWPQRLNVSRARVGGGMITIIETVISRWRSRVYGTSGTMRCGFVVSTRGSSKYTKIDWRPEASSGLIFTWLLFRSTSTSLVWVTALLPHWKRAAGFFFFQLHDRCGLSLGIAWTCRPLQPSRRPRGVVHEVLNGKAIEQSFLLLGDAQGRRTERCQWRWRSLARCTRTFSVSVPLNSLWEAYSWAAGDGEVLPASFTYNRLEVARGG